MALLTWLVACGQPAAPPRPPAPPIAITPAVAAPAPATTVAAGPPSAAPGCPPAERAERVRELAQLTTHIKAATANAATVLAELRAVLARPCLRHVEPAVVVPTGTTLEALRRAWNDDALEAALEAAVDGLVVEAGVTRLALPPEIMPPLEDDAERAIAPLRCAPSDAGCARALSYIHRAERWFDDTARLDAHLRYPQPPGRADDHAVLDLPATACWGDDDPPETFDAWVACVAGKAPRTRRYAETRLRPPERGWLVLRGRRGHYQFAEEIRAYDLATGAAYVARDVGSIVVPPSASVKQGLDGYVGRVAPDQLRELAFVLLTRDAIVPVRAAAVNAVVPAALPRTLSDDGIGAFFLGGEFWTSSSQTRIAFAYADGSVRRTGELTWPMAQDPIDTYAAELVRVLEAGLVRGCAPAKLPPLDALGGDAGKVSPIDASPSKRADLQLQLQHQLDQLRGQACRGAK